MCNVAYIFSDKNNWVMKKDFKKIDKTASMKLVGGFSISYSSSLGSSNDANKKCSKSNENCGANMTAGCGAKTEQDSTKMLSDTLNTSNSNCVKGANCNVSCGRK